MSDYERLYDLPDWYDEQDLWHSHQLEIQIKTLNELINIREALEFLVSQHNPNDYVYRFLSLSSNSPDADALLEKWQSEGWEIYAYPDADLQITAYPMRRLRADDPAPDQDAPGVKGGQDE